MQEVLVKILRRAVERGYLLEEELSDTERKLVERLVEKGILKRCYIVSPEYREDVANLCGARVLTLRPSLRAMKIVQLLVMLGLASVPMYLAAYRAPAPAANPAIACISRRFC